MMQPDYRVGRLPTATDEDYEGLGAWWVQIWDGERVVARAYGDTPDEAKAMAQRIADALRTGGGDE